MSIIRSAFTILHLLPLGVFFFSLICVALSYLVVVVSLVSLSAFISASIRRVRYFITLVLHSLHAAFSRLVNVLRVCFGRLSYSAFRRIHAVSFS